MQVSDLVKDVCRNLRKTDAAAMPGMYLQAMQAAFQRHLDDDESQESMQEFTALCTRVAQTYAGFNASATALLHIAKVGTDSPIDSITRHLSSQGSTRYVYQVPVR